MNLTEAFRALDALNEDTFSVSDDGIQKLSAFEQNDDLIDELAVIDADAETEDDLQDSYIGKVILDCTVCHSKLYKDKTEVTVDEEQELANVGEECPYCYTSDGFKVIGEVAAFNEKPVEEEPKEVEDGGSDPLEESLLVEGKIKDGLKKIATRLGADGATIVRSFAELISDLIRNDALYDAAEYVENKAVLKALMSGNDKVLNTTTVDEIEELKQDIEEYKRRKAAKKAGQPVDDDDLDELFDANISLDASGSSVGFLGGTGGSVSNENFKEAVATLERPMSTLGGTLSNVLTAHKEELATISGKRDAFAFLDSIEPEVKNKGYLNRIKAQLERTPDSRVAMFLYNIILKGDGMGSLDEAMNNVNVETDDSIVNVSSDDNGKVTVSTEPKEPATEGEEVLAPVSAETQDAILNNEEELEPTNDAEGLGDEMEEFDESAFDSLGESYLKNIYENIESYKTTNVTSDGKKLKVEGLIKFTSGNEKATAFIFESAEKSKAGTKRLIGENVHITRGKKAFTLKGSLKEGKFISESFNYNYRTKDDSGKSTRVYGTVKSDKRG